MLLKSFFAKIILILVSILSFFNINLPLIPSNPAPNPCANVFVHGLMGWGDYDAVNLAFPHWGMGGGDIKSLMRIDGFECYAASVAPTGSVWDRACELYAQLAGVRVDYGKAHSEQYGHDRFGKDFTGKALLDKEWSTDNKINLIGHSLGGATVRQLVSLLAAGSEQERLATTDGSLSPLFAGGNSCLVNAVVALSAPHDGTSAFESEDWAPQDDSFHSLLQQAYCEIDPSTLLFNTCVGMASDDNGIMPDTAFYDLTIDGAAIVNRNMVTADDVWYFSYATDITNQNADGTYAPNVGEISPLFYTRCIGMGKAMFTTPGGTVVDESWLPNDGLVNTISARHPKNEPHTAFTFGDTVPDKGIWNVLPDTRGDHLYFINGMAGDELVKFYTELFTQLDRLPNE